MDRLVSGRLCQIKEEEMIYKINSKTVIEFPNRQHLFHYENTDRQHITPREMLCIYVSEKMKAVYEDPDFVNLKSLGLYGFEAGQENEKIFKLTLEIYFKINKMRIKKLWEIKSGTISIKEFESVMSPRRNYRSAKRKVITNLLSGKDGH